MTTPTTTTNNNNNNKSAAATWRERRKQLRRKREEQEEESNAFSGFQDEATSNTQTTQTNTTTTKPHDEYDEYDDDEYVPHITAAKRMRMERQALLDSSTTTVVGSNTTHGDDGNDVKGESTTSTDNRRSGVVGDPASSAPPAPVSSTVSSSSSSSSSQPKKEEEEGTTTTTTNTDKSEPSSSSLSTSNNTTTTNTTTDPNQPTTLFAQATQLQKTLTDTDRQLLKQKEEENRILREASKVQTNALQAASELVQGVTYTTSLPTSWKCPSHILGSSTTTEEDQKKWASIRKQWHILADGPDCPPPIKSFRDMRFPSPILHLLTQRKIQRPTPIQMQGLPVALAGRDMVGIAFTGSGKTMTFSLPLVMAALEEEVRMPLLGGEGPVGIVMGPSRELVRQIYEIVDALCQALSSSSSSVSSSSVSSFPSLRAQLMIGGENGRDQLQTLQSDGIHCVVATPGRLRDFLKKKRMTLDICRYICLDEADRMLDLGFDEEVGEIMNYFHHQRQTLLFSATFPKKFQDFARQTLVQPIVVNVGRAGAANLDVIQEVEYVKQEAKIVYLLECLQKTAPPVVVFCERKGDVDDIHEYLLLKGVEAVSIHGGKEQDERNEAIQLYKEGKKDVLVATDVAAKGLDFADIQHVINFDMPSEIENYVHRIGRTGRCGKTGVATTFINKSCEETTLLDLKHLLKEARQRIPPVLLIMDDPLENVMQENNGGSKGCAFCGGLGHSIVDCPKIDKDAKRVTKKDALASGDGYGGDW